MLEVYALNIAHPIPAAYKELFLSQVSEEKRDKMLEIKSEIKKLESKDEFEEFEYDFFINIALRDLIRMYYIKNDKWVPKDKKLLKSIKKDDKNIYDILKNESFNKYEMLLKIYKYIK